MKKFVRIEKRRKRLHSRSDNVDSFFGIICS